MDQGRTDVNVISEKAVKVLKSWRTACLKSSGFENVFRSNSGRARYMIRMETNPDTGGSINGKLMRLYKGAIAIKVEDISVSVDGVVRAELPWLHENSEIPLDSAANPA